MSFAIFSSMIKESWVLMSQTFLLGKVVTGTVSRWKLGTSFHPFSAAVNTKLADCPSRR